MPLTLTHPLEKSFKRKLINELLKLYPGAIVLDLDPQQTQGIPDVLFLYKTFWATLETKRLHKSSVRPNQAYWVKKMNDMSFSSFVFPENKEFILTAIANELGDRKLI